MRESALEEYLATIPDARGEPVVRELDRIIRATGPDLQAAVKYKILMFGLDGDFRTWVCAINAARKRVTLSFLYGVLLDDPREVLRGGTSVLMSWDFDFDGTIDAEAVGAYVGEAVRRKDEYTANRQAVQDKAYRAAEKAGRRPKSR